MCSITSPGVIKWLFFFFAFVPRVVVGNVHNFRLIGSILSHRALLCIPVGGGGFGAASGAQHLGVDSEHPCWDPHLCSH